MKNIINKMKKRISTLLILNCFGFLACSVEKEIEPEEEVITQVKADFHTSFHRINENDEITFTDISEGSPSSWEWTFEGGFPSISNEKEPKIVFKEAGVFSVSLTVSNKKFSDVITKSGYVVVLPTIGLQAFFPFNGNAEDKSLYDNDGTVMGATLTTDRHSNLNSAYNFNGETDFINTFSTFDFENRSLSLWINPSKLDGVNPQNHIAISQDDNNLNFGILRVEIDNHNLKLWGGGTSGIYETYEIEVDKWYHLVLIRDETKTYYYINNNLVHVGEATGTGSTYDPNNQLIIGAGRSTSQQFFAGKIDDIRIYDRVLSEKEIEALFVE